MRIEVLPYVIMAAETGSITRAAEEGHLSQTTLSAAIRAIERELGIVIFQRTSKGIMLTEDGNRFIELARRMVDCYQSMEELSDTNGYLTVYLNTAIHQMFMDEIYGIISRHGVSVSTLRFRAGTFFAHDYAAQIHHSAVLDFCDSRLFEQTAADLGRRGYEVIPLMTSRMMFYVNRKDPLAARPFLSTRDMDGYSIVLSKYSLWYMNDPQSMKRLKRGRVVDGTVNLIFEALANPGTVAFLMDPLTLPAGSFPEEQVAAVPWKEDDRETGEESPSFLQYLMYHKAGRFTVAERDILREICRLLIK